MDQFISPNNLSKLLFIIQVILEKLRRLLLARSRRAITQVVSMISIVTVKIQWFINSSVYILLIFQLPRL